MLYLSYKNHGIRITDVWFPTDDWRPELADLKTDIFRVHGHPNGECLGHLAHKQYTLITDLTQTEDDLMQEIQSKNFKYEIRRSHTDDIQIRYYDSKNILDKLNILDLFATCYDEMFRIKGVTAHFNKEAIKQYAEQSALLISIVMHNESPIVFHSYIIDGSRSRFFHSCSSFREDKTQAQLIGRANKRLHWEDWLYLKQIGITRYDWGGIFSPESNEGIDIFKRAFGGKTVYYFNAQISQSIAGKVAVRVLGREG